MESIFTSDWGCGMNEGQGTPPTPVQIANCRLLDRAPLDGLGAHPHVVRAYGEELPDFGSMLRSLMVVAGIRSAKSMMMSACAIKIARTCYVGAPVKPSDSLRVPIVSPEIDTSKATLAHVIGILENSDILRPLILKQTADSVTIEHESGRPVEIKVVALAAYGRTLVGRWLPGIIFEEIFLMGSSVDYVKNLEGARDAIHGRVLPGGLEMLIGSAEGAIGPAFELFQQNWGKPNADFLVCKAEGPLMNPVTYSPENCAELERTNADAFNKNVMCVFSDPEFALLSRGEIEAAEREDAEPVPPDPHWSYSAGMDPATRSNAWTLVVMGGNPEGGYETVLHREWKPRAGAPLSPKAVIAEMAGLLKPYGVPYVMTDQNMAEALIDIAAEFGVVCVREDLTGANRLPLAEQVVALLRGGLLSLPKDPQVRSDFQNMSKRISSNGNASLSLPKTKDGRHCDYIPAYMLALKNAPAVPKTPDPELTPVQEFWRRVEQGNDDGSYRNALARLG
ncbi:MAG TPA: hypothetical protein VFZ21_30995 [Gemmatimonadaceae bacterium]|nr:hypothetical protein [Gemmatimonadaceae bacterium]